MGLQLEGFEAKTKDSIYQPDIHEPRLEEDQAPARARHADLYLKADGTSQVAVGKIVDSGTWSPTETGYCATWKRIRAGEERCFKVVNRDGKMLVLNDDGSLSTEVLQVVE